jgi:heme exporter protein C
MSKRILTILTLAALVALGVGQWFIWAYAPVEETMGLVQKIFYIHMPLAWWALVSFFVVFAASIRHLMTRSSASDILAGAAAELGVLLSGLALVSGSIWGRAAWNVWWTWDARLTSTLVLWLIYAGYLILRSFMAEDLRMRRYAAVLGIIGALNVPIVYFSVRWFRTMHPQTFINEAGGLDPVMKATLGLGVMAVVAVFLAILAFRLRLGALEAATESLRASLEAGDPEP